LPGLLTSLFRRDGVDYGEPPRQPLAEPTATDTVLENGVEAEGSQGLPNRQQPTPPSEAALRQPLAKPTATDTRSSPAPTRRWVSPAEHAAALLDFLQGAGGRTGTIPFDEMEQIHLEVCLERDFEPIGWTAVGRELRKLIGDEKTYERINGAQVRVYRIPPRAQQTRIRAACAKRPRAESRGP
jgi:hypothetical protein